MKRIAIIGAGRMGGALAIALTACGYEITELIYRSIPKYNYYDHGIEQALISIDDVKEIKAEILLITTGDPEIYTAADYALKYAVNAKFVYHTSGSLSSEIFTGLHNEKISFGSIHPLVSISEPVSGSSNFANGYFCVEGQAEANAEAEMIVSKLGGRSFTIESAFKPLYHAAGVMSAGHVTALFDSAIGMLEKCNIPRDRAKDIILPLLKSTVTNIIEHKTEDALTGPYARVDEKAFERHFSAMQNTTDKETQMIYLLLAEHSLKMTARKNDENALLTGLIEKVVMAKNSIQ